jgi:thiol-disulfide isomerase/thioredoxin
VSLKSPWKLMFVAIVACLVGGSSWAGEFPESWFYATKNKIVATQHKKMVGKPAPALSVKKWLTTSGSIEKLKGKVVLVDFWATWCGPCMQALPHNNDLLEKYEGQGLAIIAIHDGSSGTERAPGVVQQLKIKYPLGIDDGRSVKAWNVGFWPTLALIDRQGKLRAIGLRPNHVESAIKKLIAESAPSDTQSRDWEAGEDKPAAPAEVTSSDPSIDAAWLEGDAAGRERLTPLTSGPTAPPLRVENWRNGSPTSLVDLKGKVVLLQFWKTSCAHSKLAIPDLNDLHRKYGSQGLVVIGVAHSERLEDLDDVIKAREIQYSVCGDPRDATSRVYKVDTYPDYYLIDRNGRVRAADVKQESLAPAIESLLKETAS